VEVALTLRLMLSLILTLCLPSYKLTLVASVLLLCCQSCSFLPLPKIVDIACQCKVFWCYHHHTQKIVKSSSPLCCHSPQIHRCASMSISIMFMGLTPLAWGRCAFITLLVEWKSLPLHLECVVVFGRWSVWHKMASRSTVVVHHGFQKLCSDIVGFAAKWRAVPEDVGVGVEFDIIVNLWCGNVAKQKIASRCRVAIGRCCWSLHEYLVADGRKNW